MSIGDQEPAKDIGILGRDDRVRVFQPEQQRRWSLRRCPIRPVDAPP
jgi:hypothetical protein